MITDRERQILQWMEEDPLISQQEIARRAGITRSSVGVHISNMMKKGLILGKGYLVQREPYIVVVGGANIDIAGKSFAPLVKRDSNPGTVSMSPGGVGRNIAQNLVQLGQPVKFITAIGQDAYGSQLRASCQEQGIDLSHAMVVPDGATSTYVYISGPDGDMELAISDMQIYEHLTPAFLARKATLIDHAALCVMDTNLTAEAVRYLAENCRCPLFVDPVSTTKAHKLEGLLGKLHTLKPNLLEAELLSGVPIHDEASLEKAAQTLLEKGLKQVFISLGAKGVYCADATTHFRMPAAPAKVVNATGAGDSFMAAIAWAWRQGDSLVQAARAGTAAAAICIESPETISPALTEKKLCERIPDA